MLEYVMRFHMLLYGMITMAALGVLGMFFTGLMYKRMIRNTGYFSDKGEKWRSLWKMRDRLLRQMNHLVWYPSLFSILFFITAFSYVTWIRAEEGLPLIYLYVGTAVPILLLLCRQAFDFSYREELIMGSLEEYIEEVRKEREEDSGREEVLPFQEEIVDRITKSIRETAATGSHFRDMLTEEEIEIMKEIIREFMEAE